MIRRAGTLRARRQPNRLRTRGDVLRMDDVDRRIIALLGADARASYAEIGAQVSLSAPAVKRRVDRLRAAGVIRGFTAVIHPAAEGWAAVAVLLLFCTRPPTPARPQAKAPREPAVGGAGTT